MPYVDLVDDLVDTTTARPEAATPDLIVGETPRFIDAVLAPFRDALLAGRTRIALLAALGGDAGEIGIEAYRSNVILNGDVATQATSDAAEEAVRTLPGVVGVSNRLRVRGAQCLRPGGSDAEIRTVLTARLRQAPALRGSIITVENVYDGVVRLTGVARDARTAVLAFELAIDVPGVRRVIDDVVPHANPPPTMTPTRPDSDWRIAS